MSTNLYGANSQGWTQPDSGNIYNGNSRVVIEDVQFNNPIQWQGQTPGNSALLVTNNTISCANGPVGRPLWSDRWTGGRVQTPRPKYKTNYGASSGPDLGLSQNLFVQVGSTPPMSSLYPTVS